MPTKETDALKRACAYSFPPNRLGYCGPEQSFLFFREFLSNPSEENACKAKEMLKKFSALFPYLELIAKANGKQAFDAEAIEAYWIGNSLLENVSFRETQKAILSFQLHGLPRKIAEEKASNLPDGMPPHHSMHVLYVNFISKKVPALTENLSNCLIQWAKVKEISKNGIKAKGIELFSESKELKIREKEKTIENPFNLQLQEKDFVSVHWGSAIEKISEDEFKRLKKYTSVTIGLLANKI